MGFYVALRFLTALPLPDRPVKPEEMGRSAAYFALVGLLIGGAVGLLDALLRLVWPTPVASAGVLAALVLVSGGLHLDGLMDSCDGLFGRRDPARRLEIMRDSHVGSFGVLGAVLLLLLKYAALVEVAPEWRLGGLVAAVVLGRTALVLAIWAFPYARAEGTGRAFKDGVGPWQLGASAAVAAATALTAFGTAGAALLAVALGVTLLSGVFVRSRVPGLTGDSYGAINELVEVSCLLALVAMGGAARG